MAVTVSKSGGIYIEISGDYSKLQADLREAGVIGKSMGKEISDALSGALTPKSAANASASLNKYLATARRSAEAARADLSGMDKQFREMGRSIGIAEKSLDGYVKMQRQMYQTQAQKAFSDNLKGIQRVTGQTDAEMNRLAKSLGGVGDEFRKAGNAAGSGIEQITKRLVSLSAAYVGIRELSGMASAWTDLTSRVQLATRSQEEARTAMDRIAASANRTYASLDSTAEIFLRNADAFSDLGLSVRQQLDFMESMTDALVVSGAKGQRAEAVINALSKAMMAGTLKGENWNTVLQQGGRVVTALADGLGVSITQLRAMAAAGELTSAKMFAALTSQMGKLKAESEAMPATIQDAFVKLKNTLTEAVGQMDGTLNATTLAVKAIDALGSSVSVVAANIKPLIVTYVAWKVATLATSDAVKAQIALMRGSVVQIGATQTALKSLTGVAASARAGMGSIVAAAGGPLVLGITAAAGAIAYLASQESAATVFAREHADAMQMVSTNADTAKQAIDSYAKKLQEMNEAQRAFEQARIARERADITSGGSAYRTIVNDITPLAAFDNRATEIGQKLRDAAQLVLPSNIMEASVQDLETLKTKVIEIATEYGRTKEAAAALETIDSLIVLARQADIAAQSVSNVAGSVQQVAGALSALDPNKMAQGIRGLEDKVAQARRTAVGQASATALISIGVDSSDIDKFGNISQEAFARYDEATQASIVKTQALARELHALTTAAKAPKTAAATASDAIAKEISAAIDQIAKLTLAEDEYRQRTIENKIAEYQRLGASAEEIQKLTSALRELHAVQDAQKASAEATNALSQQTEKNAQVVERFYAELRSNAVLGYADWLAVQEESIARQRENFERAGVDIVDIEQWVAQERMKIARESAVEIEAAYRMANLEAGIGTFEDGLFASLARITEGYTNVSTSLTETFGDFFSSFSQGFADSIGRAVVESENLGTALHNVAKSAISSLISALVQLGIQYVVNAALGQSIASASMAASTAMGVASASTLAAAYAPAAAAVSLASFGANAAPAITGITSTYGLTKMLSVTPGFKDGGYTGNLGENEIAGVVHGGEYVFDAKAVQRIGVDTLESMQKGSIGSAPPASARSDAFSQSGATSISVSIENYGTSKDFEVQQLSESEVRIIARDEARGVTREYAPKVIASDISNPNSAVSKSLSKNTKAERRR